MFSDIFEYDPLLFDDYPRIDIETLDTRDLQQMLYDTYGHGDDVTVHETSEYQSWEVDHYFKPPEDLKDQILTKAEFNAKYRNPKRPEDDGLEPGDL